MYVLQIEAAEPVDSIVSVALRPTGRGPALGSWEGTGGHQLTLRYVTRDGVFRRYREGVALPVDLGRRLVVVGCLAVGRSVTISCRPHRDPVSHSNVEDRLTLPFELQAWGVTALRSAAVDLRLGCRSSPGALFVAGVARIRMDGAQAPLWLRLPFCRVLSVHSDAVRPWSVVGAVSGLAVRVSDGGRIEGELTVHLHASPRSSDPVHLPPVRMVREVKATVEGLAAEIIAEGQVMARGELSADLYWMDVLGQSRWTGRRLSFSQMIDLPGVTKGDDITATAAVEGLKHRAHGGGVTVAAVAAVTVTSLRPEAVSLPSGAFQLERIINSTCELIPVQGTLVPDDNEGAQVTCPPAEEAVVPIPATGAWTALTVRVGRPELVSGGGTAHYRLPVTTDLVPYESKRAPVKRREYALGAVQKDCSIGNTLVGGITSVGSKGVGVSAKWCHGAVSMKALPLRSDVISGEIALPRAVRSVLSMQVQASQRTGSSDHWAVRAVLRSDPAGVLVAEGLISAPVEQTQADHRRPVRATGIPFMRNGNWYLRVDVVVAPE